jgi:hypothetical protein
VRARGEIVAVAVLAAVAVLGGCASDPLPVATVSDVDAGDPDQVIAGAVETMFTWNPPTEDSANVAYRRASVYLSGDLAGQGGNSPPPAQDSQWAQWRADGATVAAKAYFVGDETPPNSDTVMHRVVVVVQSVTTGDRRLIDEIRHTAWVTAQKSNNGWRVTSMDF